LFENRLVFLPKNDPSVEYEARGGVLIQQEAKFSPTISWWLALRRLARQLVHQSFSAQSLATVEASEQRRPALTIRIMSRGQ